MSIKKIPHISKEILEYLESMFPDKLCVNLSESQDSFRVRQGQLLVVNHLKSLYERQQAKALIGDP